MADIKNSGLSKTDKKAKGKGLELRKKVVIRNAVKDDLEKILEIENSSFNRNDAFSLTFFKRYLREPKGGFFVLLDKTGSIAGYAILGEKNGKGYLLSIAIHPKKRNHGFATSLLKFLESKCYEKGFTKMALEVRADNKEAFEIYRKLGFVDVGKKRYFYEDGADALIMEKNLPV